MTLSEEARRRLADIVELQPTKNRDLMERWELESGSEVHQYLETELEEYYYRDENSLIRATADAAELVGVEPGLSEDESGTSIRVSALEAQVFAVLPDSTERSQSVVSTLHALREEFGVDPTAEAVREAIQTLKRKGVVEVVYRTVPTFRLSRPRDEVTVNTD
ncbi:MAG TPA: DUF5797 family protein [Halobacteriales archaeon]|nr:DUF5797 family protein [Halobacteriales archaeon]